MYKVFIKNNGGKTQVVAVVSTLEKALIAKNSAQDTLSLMYRLLNDNLDYKTLKAMDEVFKNKVEIMDVTEENKQEIERALDLMDKEHLELEIMTY